MFDGLLPAYVSELIQSVPQYIAFKWLAISFVCIAIIAILSIEQRRMNHYYQRLASHASVSDGQAVEYIIQLLSISSRNKLLFSISLLILTFSLIFYDIKQQNLIDEPVVTAEQQTEEPDTAPVVEPEPAAGEPVAVKTTPSPSINALRRQYVHWVGGYYILEHCQRAKPALLREITDQIREEAAGKVELDSFIESIKKEASSEVDLLRDSFECGNFSVNILAAQTHHLIELKK